MLLPRVGTAVVGVPLILFLVHLGSVPFLVFVVAVSGLACWEYGTVLAAGRVPTQRWLVVLSGMALTAGAGLSTASLSPETAGRLPALALTGVVAAAVLRELLRRDHDWQRAANSVFGALFIGWGLAHLVWLRGMRPDGAALTWLLFLTIWLSDIAAYFIGLRFGSRPLAPQVSPKKTWEGFAAALVAGGLTVLAAKTPLKLVFPHPGAAFALGALLASVGQASDLSESMIKRAGGVKDSARILPGHGGVMDRFDSFYLAAPLLYHLWSLSHG